MGKLCSVLETNALIEAGCHLYIAGDEAALFQLDRGSWIGGTIPYFLTTEGGVVDREKLFVVELPDSAIATTTRLIGEDEIGAISTDAPENGLSLVIIPAASDILIKYGLAADHIPSLFATPIIGWVAGVHLDEIGIRRPKVFDGVTGGVSDKQLVVMHVTLPADKVATIGILNLFEPGGGDEIIFDQTGFSGKSCKINGQPDDFYDYARRMNLDLSLPLVADRCGERINISFQKIDHNSETVKFYAPILKDEVYRQATIIQDYRSALVDAIDNINVTPFFTCNCILNYIHGKLEGPQKLPMTGPATFGEIAYILLNQTMVYVMLVDATAQLGRADG